LSKVFIKKTHLNSLQQVWIYPYISY